MSPSALGSALTESLLLAGAGMSLLPVSSGAGRRLAWLAARRWPAGSSNGGRATSGALRRARLALVRRPIVGATGLAAAGWLLAGPVPGLLAGLIGLVVGYCWRRIRAERASSSDTAALLEAVTAIMAEHAAGANLGAALERAAPSAGRHGQSLRQAGRLASLGRQPADALVGEPTLARLAVATALVGRSGVSVEAALAGVRCDLRSEQRVRGAVAEAVAGPRSSALLLTGLPVAGLAMGVALGAHPQRILLHTTLGLTTLAVGVALNLAGLCWVLKLTTMEAPTARRGESSRVRSTGTASRRAPTARPPMPDANLGRPDPPSTAPRHGAARFKAEQTEPRGRVGRARASPPGQG